MAQKMVARESAVPIPERQVSGSISARRTSGPTQREPVSSDVETKENNELVSEAESDVDDVVRETLRHLVRSASSASEDDHEDANTRTPDTTGSSDSAKETSWEILEASSSEGYVSESASGDGDVDDDVDSRSKTKTSAPQKSRSNSPSSLFRANTETASSAMRRLEGEMTEELKEKGKEKAKERKNKKQKNKSSETHQPKRKLRVRIATRRYKDLGLSKRECAALAIANELLRSDEVEKWNELKRMLSPNTEQGVDYFGFSDMTSSSDSFGSLLRNTQAGQKKNTHGFSSLWMAFARVGGWVRSRSSYGRFIKYSSLDSGQTVTTDMRRSRIPKSESRSFFVASLVVACLATAGVWANSHRGRAVSRTAGVAVTAAAFTVKTAVRKYDEI